MTARHLLLVLALVLLPTRATAQTQQTSFQSQGVELKAYLHTAPERPPRALAVVLTGNPGSAIEASSPVAEALMAAGLDVFRFNYRGLWGNAGDFNLANAMGDLDAALDYLTAPQTIGRFGHDPSQIVLIGNSFGTATALVGARGDGRVDGIVSWVPCDHGYFGRELADPDSEIRAFLDAVTEALFGEGGPIEGGGPVFVNDLVENSESYSFMTDAESLLGKKLLFLAGLDDAVCYAEDHLFPLYRKLTALDHPALDVHVLNMDHGFRGVGFDALMQHTTDWLEAAFPAPAAPGGPERE